MQIKLADKDRHFLAKHKLLSVRFLIVIFLLSVISITTAVDTSASSLKAVNIEFKIPLSGAERPSVPYVMFNVDNGEIGQANIAIISIESKDGQYSYYDIAGSYSHYELIEGKYSRSVVPVSDVADNTVFNEIKIAIVPTSEYNSGYFEPQSYMDSLAESYFVEGQNKLTIDLTIEKTESSSTKTFKRMGWYGQFLLPGMPANSMISIKQVTDVISGRNAVTDGMGVYEFEDTPIHGIGWLLGLGDLFSTPEVSTHEIWSYIAKPDTPSNGITPYIFSYTKYPVDYDMHYDSTVQTLVFNNELSNNDTVIKTIGDSAFSYTAVNRTSNGGTIKYSVPSGNGVAAVNSSTGLVTITGVGTVTVTATASSVYGYGTTTISYNLQVMKKSVPHEINFENSTLSIEGKTVKYLEVDEFTEAAQSGTAGLTPIVYSSSNEDVAVVDSKGRVVINGYGVAVITAFVAESVGSDIIYLPSSISYTLTVQVGDVNGDNKVDNSDMLIMTDPDNYNKAVDESSAGGICDVNGDGVINFLDLAMAKNYLSRAEAAQ